MIPESQTSSANDIWSMFVSTPWYSDKISLIGFFLTFCGIVLTGIQATRARNSAEEASRASKEAVQRVAKFSNVAMLTSAIEKIERINSFHREKIWHQTPSLCTETRNQLAQIRALDLDISEEGQIVIQRALTNLAQIQTSIVNFMGMPPDRQGVLKSSGWDSLLAKDCEQLNAIVATLKYGRT